MPLAYLLINCEHGEEQGIIKELKELPEIVEAYHTAGAYDLIAKINAVLNKM
jgi:DNA-binding Lrp family transcriptional regulator